MNVTVGIPHLILDLVIDALICSMNALPLEALAAEVHSVTSVFGYAAERRAFLNMSLAHPSWTNVVRRGLWHRIILRANDFAAFNLSVNAENCLHIRELALLSPYNDHAHSENMAEVLRHSPNVRFLYADIETEGRSDPGFSKFLQQLRTHTNLEILWLVGLTEACFGDIQLTVSYLQGLKSLLLDTSNEDYQGDDVLQEVDPPKELKSFAMVDSLHLPFVSWLIRPRERYRISDLAISLENPGQLEEGAFEQIRPALPLLQTLYISTAATDAESERNIHADSLAPLLSQARNLRYLTLDVSSTVRTQNLRLPDTLILLHIHHDIVLKFFLRHEQAHLRREDDSNVLSIISVARPAISSRPLRSQLREVVVSFVQGDHRNQVDNQVDNHVLATLREEAYPETYKACVSVGISLSFKTYAASYFGTLAENRTFAR